MASTPADIWVLIFQQLIDDHETLLSVSLVCRAWRLLSWPSLLTIVDLSSHNIERRLTEHEHPRVLPIVYSHHHAKYRPRTLVPRQRNFLRLLTAQPALAKHVKSFTWTLVWRDSWAESDRSPLLDIDRETWNVFASLLNVTHLDLASIHDVWDDDIFRKNPAHLFPRTTHLRLLGWMHRGLVKAILDSLDATKLRSLKLDYLEDQGTFPNGDAMNMEVAVEFAKTARRGSIPEEEHVIDDRLFQRQEMGEAAVFPGPMWFPMRLLSSCSLDSLSQLQITVPSFGMDNDIRNYYTTFGDVARLLRCASSSLRSIVVIFAESQSHYYLQEHGCGNGPAFLKHTYQPWCIKMAATFLTQVIVTLSGSPFPNLTQLSFKGFHLLESEGAGPDLGGTLRYVKASRFNDVNFTGMSHVDARQHFEGFYCNEPDFDEEVLRNS